jgi:hypothetical protein
VLQRFFFTPDRWVLSQRDWVRFQHDVAERWDRKCETQCGIVAEADSKAGPMCAGSWLIRPVRVIDGCRCCHGGCQRDRGWSGAACKATPTPTDPAYGVTAP